MRQGEVRPIRPRYLGLVVEGAPLVVVLELLLLPRCFAHLPQQHGDDVRGELRSDWTLSDQLMCGHQP